MPNTKPRQISLLLFEGFSNLCLANAVEPLRAANTLARAPLYHWRHLAMSEDTVRSSSGLPVQPEALTPAMGGDYLFVMPSYGHAAFTDAATCRRLRAAATQFGTLVGLDTGAWLLAAAGLLEGHRATCHWDLLTELSERFPQVDVVEDRVVFDGPRASCGGASTTLELMLALIEAHHGASLALDVAALFMFGEPGAPRPERPLPAHRAIQAAAALMRRNVEAPLTIAEIARGVGLGQRALEQAFRAHAGTSPAQAYRRIRLTQARRRLEETRDSVAEIALRAGYRDATAMTRAFRAQFGVAPSVLRKAANSQRP